MRTRCRDYSTELACPVDRFLPFVVTRPTTGQGLDCILVYSAVTDQLVTTVVPASVTIAVYTDAINDYYVYFGAAISGLNLPCGRYYLDVKGQVSEVFGVVDNLSAFLKIEWKNSADIAGLPYSLGFMQRLYLNAAIGQPSYPYREEGEKDGNGEFVPLNRSVAKTWQFDTQLVPEFLLDVLQSLTLHDTVTIGSLPAAIAIKAKVSYSTADNCANLAQIDFSEPAVLASTCAPPLTWLTVNTTGYIPKPWLCGGPATTTPFWEDTGVVRCITTTQTYPSAAISQSITPSNCPAGSTAAPVPYTLAAGYYVSSVSQTDADTQALAYYNSTSQAYANTNGICKASALTVSVSTVKQTSGAWLGTFQRADTIGSLLIYYVATVTNDAGTSTFNKTITILAGSNVATVIIAPPAAISGSAYISRTTPATYTVLQ